MSILWIPLLIAAGVFAYRRYARRQARRNLLATPISERARAIVLDQVPLVGRLPAALREKLEGRINLFLDQIEFYGCDGLEVTEEMRLSIAAQACLLVVNNGAWYTHLRTVLIYPGAFKSMQRKQDGYIVTERETVRLGESWARGPVILSWAHSEQGAADATDGHNVVLHEFAHQLDGLSGYTDGAPVLGKGHSLAEWERVFVAAFERHVWNVENGRGAVIDAYGAQGQEEYFAVAIEAFFEKPLELKRAEPEVYAELAKLFRLEPHSWV